MSFRGAWQVVRASASNWAQHNSPQVGAALAYYTIFSIAPLVIIALFIVGVAAPQQADQAVHDQLTNLVGEESASAILRIVQNAKERLDSGLIASLFGLAAVIFGASGIFKQLTMALNAIWEVSPVKRKGFIRFLRNQSLAFAMVVGIGFLLIASLILSSILTRASTWTNEVIPIPAVAIQWIDGLAALVLFTAFFAAIFKVLPDTRVRWKDVWIGAFVTSILFTLGKFLIGLYLGHSAVRSTYGAAGSVVALLVWAYYSAQIILFGAELTHAYAEARGHKVITGFAGAEGAPAGESDQLAAGHS